MSLFGIKNDSATLVAPCVPWAFTPNVPTFDAKGDYIKWRGRESTDHLLFTSAEGSNADLRPNKKTNPVRRLHALIADYDADITDAMEEAVVLNAPADLHPNWISTTFSGGRRLVWLFEEPLPFDDVLAKRFLEVAGRELQVSSLLPGIDSPSWLSAYKFYDVGTNWRQLSDTPLSTKVLHFWLTEASKKTDWGKVGELHIPLADVEEQLHKQFPGVWSGEFAVGTRGPVFWEGRQNPSAGVVTEAGMLAFSSHKLFHTWGEIFGVAFIKQYQADKIGAAVANIWWDGRLYYRKLKDAWVGWGKEDFAEHLCVNFKLDSSKGKNETASETSGAMVFIRENRQVDGVIPRLFDPRDIIEVAGKKYLNCSRVKPAQPHEEPQMWGTKFPWCAKFLEMRFDEHERQIFLAWWKRFYCSALQGDLLKGQALFIVGDVKLGKTLMSYHMIGNSVGGAADASAHITKGSEFNKELFEVGLRCIDDGEVASDAASHRKFSEAVKRMVANPTMVYRAMYRDAQSITYNGRLLITLNDDAYSLQMIPDLELSMEEKILVLKFNKTSYLFPPKFILEPMIAAELPYLLRWLVDWEVPADIQGDNRLGVKAYINEELRGRAMHSGQAGDLLEIIDLWAKRNGFDSDTWSGSASEWFTTICGDESLKPLVTKFTPRLIGKRFAEASRIRDSGVSVLDSDRKRGNTYEIDVARDRLRKAVRIKPGE